MARAVVGEGSIQTKARAEFARALSAFIELCALKRNGGAAQEQPTNTQWWTTIEVSHFAGSRAYSWLTAPVGAG